MTRFMIIDAVVRIAVGFIGLIANSLQMSCVLKKKHTKLPFDLTVLSLSIADLLTSASLLVFGVYDVLVVKNIAPAIMFVETINEAALDLSIVTSLIHVEYIAVQRLFAVLYPIKFQVMFTKFRCNLGLVFIWIICAGYCTWSSWEKTRGTPTFTIISYTTLLSTIFLLFSYTIICYKVFRKRGISRSRSRQDYALLFNSILVGSAFLVCTLPFTFQTLDIIKSNTFYQFIIPKWFLFLNIILDPFIYFLFKYYRITTRLCLACLPNERNRSTTRNEIPLLSFKKISRQSTMQKTSEVKVHF